MLKIIIIPVLTDNYIYLIHDPVSRETAVVDPALAQPVLDRLQKNGWQLTYIWNTHHHSDHVGGNLQIKKQTGCKIIAAQADWDRIPGIDQGVSEGDVVSLGQYKARVIATPGHTREHIVYHFAEDNILFCGDTLFVMGCGRLFSGGWRKSRPGMGRSCARQIFHRPNFWREVSGFSAATRRDTSGWDLTPLPPSWCASGSGIPPSISRNGGMVA